MSKEPSAPTTTGADTVPPPNLHDAPTLVQGERRPRPRTGSLSGLEAEITLGEPEAGGGSPQTDRFDKRDEIGRGGMATVYRVFDPRLLRDAAMKCLDARGPGRARTRFIREARITGQLEHPNVVPVHELGLDADGGIFLNMKLIRGKTLRELVAEAGDQRLKPEALTGLLKPLMKVCDAVAYAHSRGVVHRDLKPSNIMVGEFGQVYLLDWGIAKVVDPEAPDAVQEAEEAEAEDPDHLIGTPAFMAPEQAAGKHDAVDRRTDVFALGGLLYFILTGKGPYGGSTAFLNLCKALEAEVVPPEQATPLELPRPLVRIAMKAMSYDPADRYPDATAFRDDVERFLLGTWQLSVRTVSRGEILFREGEPGEVAYVIQEGRCAAFIEVDGERRVLREMGPGEVFGETAIFARRPRSASVVALTELVVQEVDRSALEDGLGLNSWMGAFVTALAQRFLELDERLRADDDTR